MKYCNVLFMLFVLLQGLLGTRLTGWVTETRTVHAFIVVFFLLNTTLPILVAAASYFTIMFAVSHILVIIS